MKKIFFFAAIAAAALSSCSSDELVQAPEVNGVEDGAVLFSANTMRANREAADATNFTEIAGIANAGGFGVFAYEQGRAGFSTFAANTSYPNFMYNQNVWAGASATATTAKTTWDENNSAPMYWLYSPVKYYSNNEGAKHSFFAYAPYRSGATPVFTLGKAPQIRYNVRENYDLMWSAPVLDKEKAGITEKINFNFKHALSKVTFHVAPFINAVHPDHKIPNSPADLLTSGTKVTVKSIRFVGNVPSQALLNLQDGKWTIENTQEGEYLVDVTNFNWDSSAAINAYKDSPSTPGANSFTKVIPSTGVKIEIVYDVDTTDGTNASNNSHVTNTIVSKEEFTLEGGKAYDFYLDLGLTSVKFDAAMTDWEDAANKTVDLPNNHDFWAAPYVVLSSAPSSTAVAVKVVAEKPDETTASTYYYNTTDGQMYIGAADNKWNLATTSAVLYDTTSKKYYSVTAVTADPASAKTEVYEYEYAKVGEKYYAGKDEITTTITPLISLTPNSDGEVQKTDGKWVKPEANQYYTVGSFLYVAKFFAPATPSNRR